MSWASPATFRSFKIGVTSRPASADPGNSAASSELLSGQHGMLASLAVLIVLVATPALAQQVADGAYHFTNASPAFKAAQGPRVCMDMAHNDFQSPARNPGSYRPLVELLEGDGYRIQESQTALTSEALRRCDVLVIVDAVADTNARAWWVRPHVSALTAGEIAVLDRWIRDGGGLLLIADHTPAPGAVQELGNRLGIVVLDGFAHLRSDSALDIFSRSRGEVADHAITKGRGPMERIDSVITFTGHAFLASRDWSPLLMFGAGSTGLRPVPGPDATRMAAVFGQRMVSCGRTAAWNGESRMARRGVGLYRAAGCGRHEPSCRPAESSILPERQSLALTRPRSLTNR
jgi:hypothetical protein